MVFKVFFIMVLKISFTTYFSVNFGTTLIEYKNGKDVQNKWKNIKDKRTFYRGKGNYLAFKNILVFIGFLFSIKKYLWSNIVGYPN